MLRKEICHFWDCNLHPELELQSTGRGGGDLTAEDVVKTDKTLFYNKTLVIKLGLTTHSSESKDLEMCGKEAHISYGIISCIYFITLSS